MATGSVLLAIVIKVRWWAMGVHWSNGWEMEPARDDESAHEKTRKNSIKLPSHATRDTIIWDFDKQGVYYVKWGYKLVVTLHYLLLLGFLLVIALIAWIGLANILVALVNLFQRGICECRACFIWLYYGIYGWRPP